MRPKEGTLALNFTQNLHAAEIFEDGFRDAEPGNQLTMAACSASYYFG